MVERWERELETVEFFDKGVTVGGVVDGQPHRSMDEDGEILGLDGDDVWYDVPVPARAFRTSRNVFIGIAPLTVRTRGLAGTGMYGS